MKKIDIKTQLSALPAEVFFEIRRGLEKENLRVSFSGKLSSKAHPTALGKALTNPYITTDFAESLLEVVTPPIKGLDNAIKKLTTVSRFCFRLLEDEYFWPLSMPPWVGDEKEVKIAEYGASDSAHMKHLYRIGLSHRYGRMMQAISGIHYNVSFPDVFFEALRLDKAIELKDFRSQCYMHAVSRFRAYAWILPYLFGASPFCFKTSVNGSPPAYLTVFDEKSFYAPFATSLRMSDLGYQSPAQAQLEIDFSTVKTYAASLLKATRTVYPAYRDIGVKLDGAYRQLNDCILQIENEYYSVIRPKVVSHERPGVALCRHGVEYIETRFLDLNPLIPGGVSSEALAFVDVFLLFCLLDQSPVEFLALAPCSRENLVRVATCGRRPDLILKTTEGEVAFQSLAEDLLTRLAPFAEAMDQGTVADMYQASLKKQETKLQDVSKTPAAQLFEAVQVEGGGYENFCLLAAKREADYLAHADYDRDFDCILQSAAKRSVADWQKLESMPRDFDRYLQGYFSEGNCR